MTTRPFFTLVFIISLLVPIAELQAKKPKEYKAEVSVVFNDDCDEMLENNIKKAKKTIYAAVYTFAKKSFADELIGRAKKKVKVHLILDKKQAEFEYTKTLIERMKKAGVEVRLVSQPEKGAHMHHKFAVIDGKVVLVGSFNWTRKASEANRENLVRIESTDVAKEFINEWKAIH